MRTDARTTTMVVLGLLATILLGQVLSCGLIAYTSFLMPKQPQTYRVEMVLPTPPTFPAFKELPK